jgi:hypothetical protein
MNEMDFELLDTFPREKKDPLLRVNFADDLDDLLSRDNVSIPNRR